jgi:DNA-binding MarR family transcriptional regulator
VGAPEAVTRAETAVAEALLGALRAVRRNSRPADRPVELSTLTGAQIELLRLVRQRPGVSVAQAAESLGLAANTISTLVGQLADLGLLVRSADPADRRVVRLQLAAGLRRRTDTLRDERTGRLAAAIARLTPEERDQLAGIAPVLERLAGELAAADR